MSKAATHHIAIVVLLLLAAGGFAAESLPPGAVLLDNDLGMSSWPYPRISPDGQWVAYVSNGFVSVANILNPEPKRVMEVPNSRTWPHFNVSGNHEPSTGRFDQVIRGLERDEYNSVLAQMTHTIYGLNWTYDSAGFVFGVRSHSKPGKTRISEIISNDTYLADTDGNFEKVAYDVSALSVRSPLAGILSRDRQYLVSHGFELAYDTHRPLTWNTKTNKPKATPFIYLIPSSTSDRWLGIEKDTRQLVVVDIEFEVIQRFEEFLPDKTHGFAMKWSPDERFVIWRNQIGFDHFSNWEGFRLDLQTGEKRLMDGRIMNEKFGFTGHSGEFYRCGNHAENNRGYDKMVGSHLILVPDGVGDAVELWKMEGDNEPAMGSLVTWGGITPIQMSSDGELFILSLRKWINQKDYSYFELIDRMGNRWHPRDENGDQLLAQYLIVGFADENRLLVAYNDQRMFTFPVAVVKTTNNRVN
jgi:hypothetical protein